MEQPNKQETQALAEQGQAVIPNTAASVVPQRFAWRILIGRFITRWIETFAGLAAGQILAIIALPPGQWSFSVFIQLVAPSLTALYQSGRAAWPTIQVYLNNGFRWPDAPAQG